MSPTLLDELIARGPDPTEAAPRLARFLEGGGRVPHDSDGQALLAAILASGSFLPDIILSQPGQLEALLASPWLRRAKPAALFMEEALEAAASARDFAALQNRLRRYRRREMLRLGARELGWGSTSEVARELAGLADGCLEAAVRHGEVALRSGYGEPVSPEGIPGFVVLGMGKLGGEELNFSSDVDLIYLYTTDEGSAGSLTLHEYYVRLSQMVTRALSEITADGLIFRVDLRLRPEGRSGAICNSLVAAERYYETFGRTWERQALLRARACAGDRGLGARFARMVEPFVYPRTLGVGAVQEIRDLRGLFRESADPGGFDVKLGDGGIRDVELVAQLLQLLHGGRRRELRERSTIPALQKLSLAGLLSDQELRTLTSAYWFWRQVEHRIQLEHAHQTHSLPADPADLDRFARRLGFPDGGELLGRVNAERTTVRAIAQTLGEPESGASAALTHLLDPTLPPQELQDSLRRMGFLQPEASASALELSRARLPVAWLREAVASPDPDRALANFRDLVLRGSLGLFTLLNEAPQLLRMLASLFGTSDRLSKHLLSHPALWEPLFDALGAPLLGSEEWRSALPARLVGLNEEEALREMRRYQAEEILRIGLHDVAGNLQPEEVSNQLAELAEACLRAAVELVANTLAGRHGRPDATLTILALGSFGAREMRYGSDLDLVFLYDREGATAGGMDHQEWFARLAQRLIGAMGALLDEGRLYEVDTRLRPSGEQGLLVTTYAAFDRYHHQDAAPLERVALLRGRPVYASAWPTSGEPVDFVRLLAEIAYERPTEDKGLRSELVRMRARIETERGGGGADRVHLRFSAGGLTDLEFLAAYGQLREGSAHPEVRHTNPYQALMRLCQRGFADWNPVLGEHYRFLQRASLRLRLLRDRPDDRLTPEDVPFLARTLGLSEDQLRTEARERMARVRAVFRQTLEHT